MNQHEGLIRDVPLLARLPEADLRALSSQGRVRSYPAGSALFREGDPGDSLHIVVEGAVRILVVSPAGGEMTIAMLGPGDFVGHLALLDGRPRSAGAVASLATKTLIVTRDAFAEWLSSRPKAALALLESMSLTLRRTDETLADLTLLDLPHRLAKRLLALAAGQAASRGAPRLRVTQAELASMLGVSRESVNKQLRRFERQGWVSLRRGSVTLTDVDALRTMS